MKRFVKSALCILFVAAFLLFVVFFTDAFNIFHYSNLRITSAEPNKNYVKTKYIIDNPDRFNAFVFGSSKVHNIPKDSLPLYSSDGTELHWYNMTYSMGCPYEHLQNLKTFLENGVEVKCVLIGIDDESSNTDSYIHEGELLRKPYEISERSPLGFYWSYLWDGADIKTIGSILPQVIDNYLHPDKYKQTKVNFYSFGTNGNSMKVPDESDPEAYEHTFGWYYTNPDVIEDIKDILQLCEENNIEVVFFSSPIYRSVYIDGVQNGRYLEFLKDVAEITGFYNFYGLNAYSTDCRYYENINHYRSYVGNQILKMIWGDSQTRETVKKEADAGMKVETLFGTYVDKENIDEVIKVLEDQIIQFSQ